MIRNINQTDFAFKFISYGCNKTSRQNKQTITKLQNWPIVSKATTRWYYISRKSKKVFLNYSLMGPKSLTKGLKLTFKAIWGCDRVYWLGHPPNVALHPQNY